MQNRELFESAGGGPYSYIPALNDSSAHTALLKDLVAVHMQVWEGATSSL